MGAKPPTCIDPALADGLLTLANHRTRSVDSALASLLEAELGRRGGRDPLTGALHVLALTQGALFQREIADWRGHPGDWRIGAVVADVFGLKKVNDHLGVADGNGLLRRVAQVMRDLFPDARVVRVHGDCFAALWVEGEVSEAMRTRLRAAQEGLTVALLDLVIERPHHWRVLGPVVYAELERAQTVQRLGKADAIQRRRIRMDGWLAP